MTFALCSVGQRHVHIATCVSTWHQVKDEDDGLGEEPPKAN